MRTSRFEERQRCYCAAIAGAVAAVGSVAVAAGSAYESNKNQQAQTAALSKQPKTVGANFETPGQATDAYITQYQNDQPFLQSIVDQSNATNNNKFQQQLGTVNPLLISSIGTQGTNANALLNGQIPTDVQSQVQRSAAYQALTGQGSTDSGSAHALTARDLGTTSLALQQQGSSMLGANLTNTAAVNPYNATADSLLMTPTQLLSRSDSLAAYQAGLQNKNNQTQFQNSLAASAANSYNPGAAALTSGIGAVSGLASNSNTAGKISSAYGSLFNGGGSYTTLGSNAYDANSAAASGAGGTYNPFLDTNNFDAEGNFIGNANSAYYGG